MVSHCTSFPYVAYRQQPQTTLQQQYQQQHYGESETGSQGYCYNNYGHAAGAQQYMDPEMIPWAAHYPHFQYQPQTSYHGLQQPALSGNDWSGDEGNNTMSASPPMTVCGSEISSPRTPSSPPAGNVAMSSCSARATNHGGRQAQIRSPYEWMKKTVFQNVPNSGQLGKSIFADSFCAHEEGLRDFEKKYIEFVKKKSIKIRGENGGIY